MGHWGAGTLPDSRLNEQLFMYGWVQDGEAYLQDPASGEAAIRFMIPKSSMLYRYQAGGMQREHASGFPCQESPCTEKLVLYYTGTSCGVCERQ